MSSSLEVNGIRIYYEKRGRGPAVLFVSGATGDAGHWTTVAGILADAYTVITYDRRANSRSPQPPGWMSTTVGEQADDAAALLGGLDLVPAIVVGTSAAAGILADLCLRHPHVLHGAIFHEPVFPSGVSNIGAVNAARQARIEEGMARGGPRAAMELFLRSVAGDEVYESLDPQLRERLLGNAEVLFAHRDGALPRLRPHPRPARRDTSAPRGHSGRRQPRQRGRRPLEIPSSAMARRHSKPPSSNCPTRTWATSASPSTSPQHCGRYWTATPDPKRRARADQAPDRAGIRAAKHAGDLPPPEP